MNAVPSVTRTWDRTDEARLFKQHAPRLQAVVGKRVSTSSANIEDACGYAWLQLVRHRPQPATAFAWLCTTAIREAIKLQGRSSRTIDLHAAIDVAADVRHGSDARLELIAAREEIREADLHPREAQLVWLRVAGYSRDEMAELTSDSPQTLDRQLSRAQRKLRGARRVAAEVL